MAVHLVVSKAPAPTASAPSSATLPAASGVTTGGATAQNRGGAGVGVGGGGGNFMGMAQQQMMGDPAAMASLMDSPAMASMLGNSDFMERILSANPATARLLQERPELRSMLTDPDNMRQAMRASTDPNYQRELMRNNDRAMANIEAIPGGFNALVRMHHEIGAPLEEGLRDALGGGGSDGAATRTPGAGGTPSSGPTAEALTNPWGRPSPPGQRAPGESALHTAHCATQWPGGRGAGRVCQRQAASTHWVQRAGGRVAVRLRSLRPELSPPARLHPTRPRPALLLV